MSLLRRSSRTLLWLQALSFLLLVLILSARILRVCGDLSTEDGVRAIVQEIKAVCSSLDALIHCAAIRRINKVSYAHGESLQKLEEATCSLSYAELEQSYRVNVFAPYFLTAGLTSLLGEAAKKGDGRGCVILFSSPASVHNHQFVPAYQLTKASVDHLVRILAMEFASFYSLLLLPCLRKQFPVLTSPCSPR